MKSQYGSTKAELKDTKSCCQMVRNGGLMFQGWDLICIKINQLTWSDIELWNFYKIELVPGSCHIFVVVAGACVVVLSLSSLFNLKVDGQQKTIWKSIAKGMNVLYDSISIWCCGLCINKRCYHISKVC